MLHRHARVAVVAPGGAVSPARMAVGLDFLRSLGLEPVEGRHLYARHRYLAGTHAERRADLAWALTDPDLDGVWFARGGYGTARLLADLPWDRVRSRPVFGFSDATALLVAWQRRGLPAVHAPVVQSFSEPADAGTGYGVDTASRAGLHALFADAGLPDLPGQRLCGPATDVRGPLTGGNLAVLASLSGTPWALQARGAVVVLEDVAEAPYRVDRMLGQLLDAGDLDGVAGIALGEFVRCETPGADWRLEEVLADVLAPLGVPVLAGLPVGHGARNWPWQYGAEVELTATGLRYALGAGAGRGGHV